MNNGEDFHIGEYEDEIHAEVIDDLRIGEYGYKYRMLDGVVMPPYVTPSRYRTSRTLKTRSGDICYTSYPKSGSTWLAYIIVMIVGEGEVPSDNTLRSHLQWVESSYTYPRSLNELEALPSPRIFKSHMPYRMALGGEPINNPCKYIYIARNPKDVAVSYYFFERGKSWSGNYSGPWEHWLKMFMEGRVQRGDWFGHVLSWWDHKDSKNVLFLKYEDLKRSLVDEVVKISRFLGRPINDNVVKKIVEEVSFKNMKRNRFSNMHEIKEFHEFFRKGEIGSWKEQFTAEQNIHFEKLYADRMSESGLSFDFE